MAAMKRLTRAEYKTKFLGSNPPERTECSTVVISIDTKNKLRQLCSAQDGTRARTVVLLENIVKEHLERHADTITELYKEDIPIHL